MSESYLLLFVDDDVFVLSRKLSDGLFLRECERVSKLYPNIEFRSMIIDNCCMQVCIRCYGVFGLFPNALTRNLPYNEQDMKVASL